MRTNLLVPFAEKDDAKKRGARWDAAHKVWYVENKEDMSPFVRWLKSDTVTSATDVPSLKQSPIKKIHTDGVKFVGSNYVEQPRVCNCLPWDVCDQCRDTALNN